MNVSEGDYVILAWRAPCGTCRSCSRGRPWYCFDSANATQQMTLADGTPVSPALGIGAFAEKTLVAAGQAVKVDDRARPEAAGLVGCGIMAGLGAAMNTGNVGRGDSVAVGATHTINSTKTDPVDAIRELTGGFGADVTIDAVGIPLTYEQAFYARDHAAPR